jgi:hypothetical protein
VNARVKAGASDSQLALDEPIPWMRRRGGPLPSQRRRAISVPEALMRNTSLCGGDGGGLAVEYSLYCTALLPSWWGRGSVNGATMPRLAYGAVRLGATARNGV